MKKVIVNCLTNEISEVDFTAEEIVQAEKDKENALAEEQAVATARTNQANLKASAKAKLIAGEKLTKEEANILVGV